MWADISERIPQPTSNTLFMPIVIVFGSTSVSGVMFSGYLWDSSEHTVSIWMKGIIRAKVSWRLNWPINNESLLLDQVAFPNDYGSCLCNDASLRVDYSPGTWDDNISCCNSSNPSAGRFQISSTYYSKTWSLPMVTSPFISLSTQTTAPAAIFTLKQSTAQEEMTENVSSHS